MRFLPESYDTSFVWKCRIYYSLVFWHTRRWCQGLCPMSHLECGEFPGMASNVLGHHRVGMCFHFSTSKVKWRQEDTLHCNNLTFELLDWRLSIKQHGTLSFSCFSLSENLFIYLTLFNWAPYYIYIYIYIYIYAIKLYVISSQYHIQ